MSPMTDAKRIAQTLNACKFALIRATARGARVTVVCSEHNERYVHDMLPPGWGTVRSGAKLVVKWVG
jgi:hypothetical protein